MKKVTIIIFLSFLFFNCQSSKPVSKIEKENLIHKLDSLVIQDQIAAGVPSDEEKKSKGYEKAWEDFTIIKESIFKSNHKEVNQSMKNMDF